MKKVALVLAGCGHQDGSEITEVVSLLIALSQAGARVTAFSPSLSFQTVDHLQHKKTEETRNTLVEAARILRGDVKDIESLDSKDFDALCIAGGSGAVTILSTWASEGIKCQILPSLEKNIKNFFEESKPIAATCIAPVILAKVLGKKKVTITIGDQPELIAQIEKLGAQHEVCPVDDYLTDRECKVVTTPAYMYDKIKPHQVFQGISGLAHELVEWA